MTFGILALRIWSLCRHLGSGSLAALFLPIFMHSLGDVWHLGSEDLESLPGSLLCRICSAGSGGSLQSLGPLGVHSVTCCTLSEDLPIFMHSLGDVWHLGSEDLESLQVLGPCSAGSRGSAVSGALGGPQCHLLHSFFPWGSTVSLAALFLPLFMHSLGDVWHLGSEDLESLQVLGPCSAYLYGFLR